MAPLDDLGRDYGERHSTLHPEVWQALRASPFPAAALPLPFGGLQWPAGQIIDAVRQLALADPSAFRVGMLPRTRAEYAALAARLCHVLAAADGYLPAAITADVVRTELTSTRTGRRHPVLNLTLTPAPTSTWADYFTGLDQAVRTLTRIARHTPAVTGCACTSRPPRPSREAQ
ncbi:hypothetical protein ABZ826_26230 [Streptomyces sp. NPDC047515]|uniref:hypothetical protein n=1 Tax=Streptomyces sp. NPDC047515 TaxID=3155380 RepID=UPI0033F861E2